MGEGMGIPQTAEGITPEWLTRALREGGAREWQIGLTADVLAEAISRGA